MVLITAHKPNVAPVFLDVHQSKIVAVSDILFDKGYTVAPCSKWFYEAQLDESNPQRNPLSQNFIIDLHDDESGILDKLD